MLGTTQELGPSHTIDLNGAATTVRTATWNDFNDSNHVVYSARSLSRYANLSQFIIERKNCFLVCD